MNPAWRASPPAVLSVTTPIRILWFSSCLIQAGKFDIIPTMINVGSGLALLGVATVLCDVIVLYCMKKRYYYRDKKYKYVEDYEQVSTCTQGGHRMQHLAFVSRPHGDHQAKALLQRLASVR